MAETMLTLRQSYGKKHLVNFLKELKLDDQRIINKCQEVAIRTSYYIYCRRRKERLIQNLCRTDDYIVLAILVSAKRLTFIWRTFMKLY